MEFVDMMNSIDYQTAGAFFEGMSEQQILSILKSYYLEGKTLKKIIEENRKGTAFQASTLRKHFPKGKSTEVCPYDNETMYFSLPSKQAYKGDLPELECLKCGHTNHFLCSCSGCIADREKQSRLAKEKKQADMEKKRIQIIELYSGKKDKVEITSISAEDRIYLAAILQGMQANRGNSFGSYSSAELENKSIFYDEYEGYEFLSSLNDKGIIRVAPDSPFDAFPEGDNFPQSYFPVSVNWTVEVKSAFLKEEELFEELKFPSASFANSQETIVDLWQEIVVKELFKLFEYQITELKFSYRHETDQQKVLDALKGWIKLFTPSQIYYLIWMAVRQADNDRTRGVWGNYQYHPIDFVIKKVNWLIQTRSNNNQPIESYNYPSKVTPMVLTNVFFNQIVRNSDWFIAKVPEKKAAELVTYAEVADGSFYDSLAKREEQTFDEIITGAEYYYITDYGIIVYDGNVEWLFSNEQILYQLSKQVGFHPYFGENEHFYHRLNTTYYINDIYSTSYLLQLTKALHGSHLEFYIPPTSFKEVSRLESLLKQL